MDHLGEFYEQNGKGDSVVKAREQDNGIRNMQNLETVINEGLRAALLEETPDQSLQVFLEHLGKALNGSEPIYLNRTGPAAMTTPMSGRPMVWNRKRRTFKMCPQRCAQAGIGILVSAGILSLRTWKISERRILFNMKTSNDRGFIRLWWFPCMTTKRLLDFMAWIILR